MAVIQSNWKEWERLLSLVILTSNLNKVSNYRDTNLLSRCAIIILLLCGAAAAKVWVPVCWSG